MDRGPLGCDIEGNGFDDATGRSFWARGVVAKKPLVVNGSSSNPDARRLEVRNEGHARHDGMME